jgi:hypothetical protein
MGGGWGNGDDDGKQEVYGVHNKKIMMEKWKNYDK